MSFVGRMAATCGVLVGLCLMLSACGAPKPDPKQEAQSRAVYDAIAAGDVAKVQSLVSPKLAAQITPESVKQLQLYVPSGKLVRVKTVDVLTLGSPAGPRTWMETEYDYAEDYAVLRTSFVHGAAGDEMISVDLRAETAAQIAQEQSVRHHVDVNRTVVTSLAAASLIISLLAAAELLYSRPKGWGWWLVSVLVGFCKIGVDLGTGKLTFALFSVSFLGFNVSTGLNFTPNVILGAAFSIPIFAIMSLAQSGKSIAYRRRVNRMKADAAKQARSNPEP
jgi:hypothetical protein